MVRQPKTEIILNASNIAGLVNKNPYTSRADAFMAAWKSSNKASYYAAHNRNDVQTIEDHRREIQRASPFITANLRAPRPQFLDVMTSGGPFVPDRAEIHTDGVSTSDVMKEAKRLAFTRYGNEREMCIIERVRDILPEYDFQHREDEIVRREIGTTKVGGYPIILQGKVDGLSADGKTILECKTRVHKLFMKLKEYEELQTRAYLELLPGATQVALAEAHFGSGDIPDMNIIFVPRDDPGEWMEIATYVAEVLGWVISEPALQDSLVKSKNRKAFLQNLITRAVSDSGPPSLEVQ